jgi:hypothetical protein
MTQQALVRQLWHAPLSDPWAPQQDLLRALTQGAEYDAVKSGLQQLSRLGLPGAQVSAQAQARWPNSIDMALLAFDLAPPSQKNAALVHVHNCVIAQNRRRAALAGTYLRMGLVARARHVLDQIDPRSATAPNDIRRRAELALAHGDFARTRTDIDWLEGQGNVTMANLLRMQLCYQCNGAVGLQAWLQSIAAPPTAIWERAFHIFMSEGDFRQAPLALENWQRLGHTDPATLSRAQTRLALERGDAVRAQALLHDRLAAQPHWHWQATDHVQWLRAGQLAQHPPAELLDHAHAACRIHARHDWLHHLRRMLCETVQDWRGLARLPVFSPETALISARAALRMGLSGQAAGALAPARRSTATAQELCRLMALRAEAFWMSGRLCAARKAHLIATELATDTVQRAEVALLGAEIALLAGDTAQADQVLAPVALGFPDRMAVPLTQARIAFMRGDFTAAMAAHARFNALKLAQTGTPAPPDVRDRIVEDAHLAARGTEAAFAPDQSVANSATLAGLARIVASPGLSACLLRRAHAQGKLLFQPDSAAHIPRVIAHYWQGPHGPATTRACAQWARTHPGFRQHVFDDTTAAVWMHQNFGADMAQRFIALGHAALRADLFRLCWVLRQGGLFADLDEYPRIPVTPWLEGARAVLCVERGFGTIANNFIAAEPDHPVCAMALEHVCTALDQTDTPYAWWHSGPAQWTRAAFAHLVKDGGTDIRMLSQAQYCRRVATNLPYPHKRSPDHWR